MIHPNPFEWSNKGSDYTIVVVGTKDDFKILGIKTKDLDNFCNIYQFMGMIRSLPLFKKPDEPSNDVCFKCGYYVKEINWRHCYRCHTSECPAKGIWLGKDYGG